MTSRREREQDRIVKIGKVRARSATVVGILSFFSFSRTGAAKNVQYVRAANLIVEYTHPTAVPRLASAKCSWKFGRHGTYHRLYGRHHREKLEDKWKSVALGRTRREFRRRIIVTEVPTRDFPAGNTGFHCRVAYRGEKKNVARSSQTTINSSSTTFRRMFSRIFYHWIAERISQDLRTAFAEENFGSAWLTPRHRREEFF